MMTSAPLSTRPGLARWPRLALIALGALAAAYLSWLVGHWGPPSLQLAINDAAFLPFGFVSTLSLAAAAVAAGSRRSRVAWAVLAVGFAAYAFGDVAWFIYEVVLGIGAPSPSIADLGYLAFYPLTVVGLLVLPRDRTSEPLRLATDLAITTAAATTVVWWAVIMPVVTAGAEDPVQAAVALAYPVGDLLILFALASAMLGGIRETSPAALLLLAGALFLQVIADLSYARLTLEDTYSSGMWMDVAYMAAWAVAGVAGVLQSQHRTKEDVRPRTGFVGMRALPYVATAAVFGVLVVAAADAAPKAGVVVAGVVCVTALSLLRQVLTARDNGNLRAEMARRASEARFAAIIANLHDAVVVTSADGAVTYASPSCASLLGRDPATLTGGGVLSLFAPPDAPIVAELVARSAGHVNAVGPVSVLVGPDLRTTVEVVARDLRADPRIEGIVLTLRDVSDQRRFEEQLRAQALHDPLTGLANRVLLADRLDHAIKRGQRGGAVPALLYLDLDDFKEINDTLGHDAGDQVLLEVADRLRRSLRSGDTAARLGGDEFAILLDETDGMYAATAAAERIEALIDRPIAIGPTEITVRASIGLVRSDATRAGAVEMLRDADLAMYTAKRTGKGHHQAFEPEMYAETVERVRLESELRHALDRGELAIVFQPLVRMDDEELIGVEALLRWHNPRCGLVMPTTFIPIAESTGEIGRIGRWVLEEACRTVARWNRSAGHGTLQVNVNLSPRQIEPGLPYDVEDALARTGLPPSCLVLEITESVLVEDRDKAVAVLAALRTRGIRIAIDDFGTGYSALSYLRDLPVDEIKIDRSFIADLESKGSETVVGSIISLGHGLAMTTTAEGIEDPGQYALLRELGCDHGQGFLHGRPASAEAIEARLEPPHDRVA